MATMPTALIMAATHATMITDDETVDLADSLPLTFLPVVPFVVFLLVDPVLLPFLLDPVVVPFLAVLAVLPFLAEVAELLPFPLPFLALVGADVGE
jgi:hypothetical protein